MAWDFRKGECSAMPWAVNLFSSVSCQMCTILSESFVWWGDHRSIYRSAANIAIDVSTELIQASEFWLSKSVNWLSDPSPFAKNKN